jgi:hypothetical protein
METGLTIYDNMNDPLMAIEKLGHFFGASGMFGAKNDAQGAVLAMACMIERKNPLEMARTFYIIEGTLSMRTDAMLAELRKAGGEYRWDKIGDDVKCDEKTTLPISGEAVIFIKYKGQEGTTKYTIPDAKRGQLVKMNSGWHKNPDAMLRARAVSKAMRMYAPEIVAGYYTPEEVSDFSPNAQEVPAKPLFVSPTPEAAKKEIAPPAQAVAEICAPVTAVTETEGDAMQERFDFHDFCKPHAAKINAYLVKTVKWIKEGENYMNLTDAHITRLMKSPDKFLGAVEKYARENGAA